MGWGKERRGLRRLGRGKNKNKRLARGLLKAKEDSETVWRTGKKYQEKKERMWAMKSGRESGSARRKGKTKPKRMKKN